MRAVSLYILLTLGLTGCSSFRSTNCCPTAEGDKKPPKTLLAWQPGEDEKKDDAKDDKKDEKKNEAPKKDDADKAKMQPAAFRQDTPEKESKAGGDDDAKRETPKQDKPEEPDIIVTDRPDFTEASSTVGKGRVQLEGGYTFSRNRETGVREDHSYPELLLRVGLFADWFEFRLGQNFSTARGFGPNGGPFDVSGGDDLYTGFKLGLTEQKKALPEMASCSRRRSPPAGRRNPPAACSRA